MSRIGFGAKCGAAVTVLVLLVGAARVHVIATYFGRLGAERFLTRCPATGVAGDVVPRQVLPQVKCLRPNRV